MEQRVDVAGLRIARILHDFVATEALADLGLDAEHLWTGFAAILHDLGPRNRALLAQRDALQAQIDAWLRDRRGALDPADYVGFLRQIGYLVDPPASVSVATDRVDAEIARIAGPQLVVPVSNARYALNAANARWGSLYDALYGTDALAPPIAGPFDAARATQVIGYVRTVLDRAAPLASGSHADATGYTVHDGQLVVRTAAGATTLADPAQFVGFLGEPSAPSAILLTRHGLHLELRIDRSHHLGRTDAAGIADIVIQPVHQGIGRARLRSAVKV